MDYDLKERFNDHLLSGEYIVWCDSPLSGRLFLAVDFYMIPFSLIWAGFAVFWNVSVWKNDAPFFFRLFGLPFLFVGFYVVIGRFFHLAWKRRHTYYAMTNRRLLVMTGARTLTSANLSMVKSDLLQTNKDGSGNIIFQTGVQPLMHAKSMSFMYSYARFGNVCFQHIANAGQVYMEYKTLQERDGMRNT